ncbi:MAG: flavin reductase [Clostridia bacterium]|nr:flavin reductase [Clostridia bacterium]
MKEKINVFDYAEHIAKALSRGFLLNTNGDKFNSMVIGWGHLGIVWGRPTFVAYVRAHRYTKAQLDKTREFTLSIPLGGIDPEINRICGSLSGSRIDKVKEAGLKLVEAEKTQTPGIAQYPLTVECRVLYAQEQDLAEIPEDIRRRAYPQDVDSTNPMANRDVHTAYIGEIVDAYIIRED